MELKDKILLRIALIVSIIGVIALFLIMIFTEFPEKNINELSSADVDKKISLNGIIKDVHVYNKSTVMVLSQECDIDVLIFDKMNASLVNHSVIITGKLAEDMGKRTFFADKIMIR